MTGANFQVVSMDSLSNWIEQRPPSLTNSSDLNAFFEKLASDSSDANELLTRLQQAAAEESGKFGGLRISSSSAVPSGASTPSSSTAATAVSLLLKSEPSSTSSSASSSSSSSTSTTSASNETTSLAMSSSTTAAVSWEDSSSQPPSLINDENEPPASWKFSSSTNNVLAISSGLSSLRQSSDVNLLDSATIATESVLKLVREQILEVAKQEQQQQTEEVAPLVVQPTSTTTVTSSSPPAAPVPLPPSLAPSLRIPSPSPQPTVVRGSSFSGTLVNVVPSTVPQIQSEVIYSTPVTVHEKPQVLLNMEQICAMIDCGAQLNMNALVGLGFEFEGRPFGLKLSILLQLLLHQAAFAYWMGKKSAPTASRNCRFEGATKGQTKYPKRKFCGWVNKVAEMTKPYGQEALCMALQELWSLLRLSPSEMDCTQTDNVKRVLSEFFRVHDLVMANGTNHTVTQLWINVLTTASKPEVFMRRDEQSKRKRKSNSPTPPLDDLEEDSSVSIKDEQTTLVALKPLKRSQSTGTTTKRRRSNPSPVSSPQASDLQSSSLPSSFLERATSIARS